MTILTLEHLLEIHTIVINGTGGSDGLRDLGRLEAIVATQNQNVFGEELYKTLPEKAAAIMRGVVADHPFIDGNKRTAMLAGLTFLILNEVQLKLNQGQIEDFAVKIATAHLDVKRIAIWLEKHLN